jgi:cell division protein FtsN
VPTQSKPEIIPKVPAQSARPVPTEANDAKPSIVDPSKASKVTNPSNGYSVQVAAYNHKADADKLVATLRTRGYAARVDGTVTPFRVRIGRYATENDAEDALKKLKGKRMDGFVVKAPQP